MVFGHIITYFLAHSVHSHQVIFLRSLYGNISDLQCADEETTSLIVCSFSVHKDVGLYTITLTNAQPLK